MSRSTAAAAGPGSGRSHLLASRLPRGEKLTRYSVYRRDGNTTEVEADGMWPEAAFLVFLYTEVVIMQPRELVALRVRIAEVEQVVRDDGEVWRPG
jgi:hypothetical protein